MPTIQCFLTPSNVNDIVLELSRRYQLEGCRERDESFHVFDISQDTLPEIREGHGIFFLVPRSQTCSLHGALRPRDEGWIHVLPGASETEGGRNILTLTDFAAGNVNPGTKVLRWLHSETAKRLFGLDYGIEAENVVFGGKGIYHLLGYSRDALQLSQPGAIWKQDSEGNVVFSPGAQP
jgi:hypothetical protein